MSKALRALFRSLQPPDHALVHGTTLQIALAAAAMPRGLTPQQADKAWELLKQSDRPPAARPGGFMRDYDWAVQQVIEEGQL